MKVHPADDVKILSLLASQDPVSIQMLQSAVLTELRATSIHRQMQRTPPPQLVCQANTGGMRCVTERAPLLHGYLAGRQPAACASASEQK